MNPFYKNLLFATVRKLLAVASGVLVAHKYMTPQEAQTWTSMGIDYLVDAIPAGASFVWMYLSQRLQQKKLVVALSPDFPTATENDVMAVIKSGAVTPTVKTPPNTVPGVPAEPTKEKTSMKNIIPILMLTAGLCFTPGCGSTPPNPTTIRHIATATQILAKDATTLYVQAHPNSRGQFQQAHDALAVIETADVIDFGTVLGIVQIFPIKELKNPTTVMLIQDSEIILTDLGASVPLTSVNDLRPIVTALRAGIEQGLGQ